MNGANVTRRLGVVSAVAAALVILAVIGVLLLREGGGHAPTDKAGEASESITESSAAPADAASPDPSFDNVLDDIELPLAEEEAALLSEVPRLTDPQEMKRKYRAQCKFVMTPEEIAAAETIDLWGRMATTLDVDLHCFDDFNDPDRAIKEVLFWSDELVEFTRRPDAIDASINEYRRILAVLHDPEEAVRELGTRFSVFNAASITFAMRTLDRLLASEAMIDSTLEREDDLFRIYIERDRIIKAVMEEMGEDSPWSDATRWSLAQGAFLMADKISSERTEAWLRSMRTNRFNVMWGSIPGPPDPLWKFIEQEFLDK